MARARLSRLTYWYPRSTAAALEDVNLELDGGLTLVTGPSGGGKSTLLRVLNGLVPHFHGGRIKGAAAVEGRDIITTSTRQLASSVGFVFQDPELQAVYDTVEREVAFGLENLATPRTLMRDRVDAALDATGIQHLRMRRLRTLSGGERQRVALASVLAMEPRLIVMDEPTSQLDPDGTSRILDASKRLADAGRSIVMSEHRAGPVQRVAGKVVSVERGRVREGLSNPVILAVRQPRTRVARPEAWVLTEATVGYAGRPVVADVNLAGCGGEVVVLSGPNGGGKTTVLRAIAGALSPLSGKVERRPGRVAYLPQNPTALLHRPSVQSEVELTLRWANEEEDPRKILAALGLDHVAERYPRDLSSGERQRAALAAVLAGSPRLVLLDEPTRGMDATARASLVTLVTTLREAGAAIILATHDEDLRNAVADRVVEVGGSRAVELQTVTA